MSRWSWRRDLWSPQGEHTGERGRGRAPAAGCLSSLSCARTHTHTHGERLGSLLDDEALDDVREDLGLDDGLRRLALPVVRRAAGHGGRLALGPRGHGRSRGPRRGARPLGGGPGARCEPRGENTKSDG